VIVRVLPEMVAGPLITEKATSVIPELALADKVTALAAGLKVRSGIGVKLMVWGALETVIVRSTGVAGLKSALPNWVARRTTSPAPVRVTGRPDVEVAESVSAGSPKVRDAGGVNVIVCAITGRTVT
jgi:hypothetical protein